MKVNPCPRCGGSPVLDTRTLITYIRCMDCGYQVMDMDKVECIEKWNSDNCKDACDL